MMKKITWILLFTLCVPTMLIAHASTANSHETVQTVSFTSQSLAEQFLQAAKKGDATFFYTLKDSSVLLAKDKFGNNAFHLAKNASTVQAIAAAVRRLGRKEGFPYLKVLSRLRNQRNNTGETPLIAHINYGKADTFFLFYEGSDVADAIQKANAVNAGGALAEVAGIKEEVARSYAVDNSGRTVAQAALANSSAPGMKEVVRFFAKNAPYLF